jgi:hypothetical protein
MLEDVNTKPAKAPNPKEALAQVRIMRRADSSSSSGSSGGSSGSSSSSGSPPSRPAEDEGSDGSGGSSGSSEEVSEVVEVVVESSSTSPKSARRSKYDVVYDPDDQSTWTLDGSSTVLSFGGSVPASEVLSSLSSRRRRLMQANGNADLANSAYFTTLASELADALNIFPEWVLFDNIRLDGDEVLYDVQVLLPAGLPQDDIDSIQNSLANPESLNLSVPLRVTTPIATGTIDDTELFPVPNDEEPPPVPPEVPVPTVSSPADAPTPTETAGVPEEPTQTTRPVSPPSTPVQPPSVTQTPDVAPAPIATPTTPQNVGELNVDDEPNDATPPPPPGGGGLSTGAVIAIVAVVAVLLGVSIGLFSYFSYRKKKGAATTGTWTANPASETSRGVITPAVASTATTPRDPRATPRHVLKYKSTSAPTSAAKTPTPAGAPDEEPLKQTAVLKPTAGTISGAEFEAPSPMMTKSPEYDGLKSFPIDRDGVLDVPSSESGSSRDGNALTPRASTSRF